MIKNTLLRRLKTTHPHDNAKASWDKLRLILKDCATDVETFFRHYWNSKFSHSSEDRLYKSFKRALKSKQIVSEKTFLSDLLREAAIYKKLAKPLKSDWKEKHRTPIYWSLDGLDTFRVTQPRPFLLALLSSRHVDDTIVKKAFQAIEHFHFAYTAICSLRASGMDSKYGSAARELRGAKTKTEAKEVINELISELKAKMPAQDTFNQRFAAVSVTNKDDRQKKLVQYFFRKFEVYLQGSSELIPEDLSLEHIENQSSGKQYARMIGNLLPLSEKLNSDVGSKKFSEKQALYKKSTFKVVAEFLQDNTGKAAWTKADIEQRTKELAASAYKKVFPV